MFGRTKRRVDELTSALLSKGYKAEGLHGDITQAKRLEVLKKVQKRPNRYFSCDRRSG